MPAGTTCQKLGNFAAASSSVERLLLLGCSATISERTGPSKLIQMSGDVFSTIGLQIPGIECISSNALTYYAYTR